MRGLTVCLICLGSLTVCHAGETRRVEIAVDRWAEGGTGGKPDYIRHVVPSFSELSWSHFPKQKKPLSER